MALPVDQRPISVIVVAVLCLVLGLMGLMSTLSACASLGAGPVWVSQMQQLGGTPGMPPGYEAAQAAWLESLRPALAVSGGVSLANLPLAVLLVLGGSMSLAGSDRAPGLLRWGFAYGLVFEPLAAAVTVWATVGTWDTMHAFMQVVTTPPPGAPPVPGMQEAMSVITTGSLVLGLALAVGWTLLKMALYVYGLRVFRPAAT